MKAFTTLSADSTHDSAGLMRTTRIPHGKTTSGLSPTRCAHGESVESAPASPPSCEAEWIAKIECRLSHNPDGKNCDAGATFASFGSPLHVSGHSDAGLDSSCGTAGVPARDSVSSWRPGGIGGHLEGTAEPGWRRNRCSRLAGSLMHDV